MLASLIMAMDANQRQHDNGNGDYTGRRALSSLNLSSNDIGADMQGPLPGGWKSKDDDGDAPWIRVEDGHEQDEHPGGVKPFGIIALANATPGMVSLTSLNLSSNKLFAEGTKIIAEAIKVINRVLTLCFTIYNRTSHS
jgi:hypothetical protein